MTLSLALPQRTRITKIKILGIQVLLPVTPIGRIRLIRIKGLSNRGQALPGTFLASFQDAGISDIFAQVNTKWGANSCLVELLNMLLEPHRQEERGIKGYTDIFKPTLRVTRLTEPVILILGNEI